MAISTFDITSTDIEEALKGFDLSDVTVEIGSVIQRVAAMWNALLRREGITAEIASTDTLHGVSQRYIILKSAAEVARRFTHQDPELSRQRDSEAQKIAKLLHDCPESVCDAWDINVQRGSWRTDQILTRRPPGTTRRHNRKPWGVVF